LSFQYSPELLGREKYAFLMTSIPLIELKKK